ncbi:hypothetical protein GCM10023115_49450 [Pontixanthobacter gangjinensis]|uniref:Glycerophosphoryl diester phosphodiesterase membrane domain-containing protein n=1 Tax=Christiangramia aestuarii TaxID=1028746 RepID=A0A7K1LP15_9FLAO|nr:hypothetical protein [Christiangramia aestuarii]MUP42526.1 hypothetical protein [Christiangramia aestuarii]
MNQDPIQFKRQRELGEILSVTFQFIRQNFKAAGKIYLKIVGPVLLLLIAAATYYTWTTLGTSFFEGGFQGSEILVSLSLMMLAYLLFVATMNGTIYHIILSYINNNGEIKATEVSAGMKADFGKLLLLTLICWILIFAGTMLFIIPGIYVTIPLSLAAAVLVFRREGIAESISSCFNLVKNNWWMTFASILCIGIIVYLVGLVFQLPAIIYIFIRTFTVASESSSGNVGEVFGPGYVILNAVTSTLQYLIYSITPIGVALVYFNLNEKKNFTGTYETIQNLGNNN